LPPYSPDFNPIEKCWTKIKQLLRGAKARSLLALEMAVTAYSKLHPIQRLPGAACSWREGYPRHTPDAFSYSQAHKNRFAAPSFGRFLAEHQSKSRGKRQDRLTGAGLLHVRESKSGFRRLKKL
jgi:hypothetical protein